MAAVLSGHKRNADGTVVAGTVGDTGDASRPGGTPEPMALEDAAPEAEDEARGSADEEEDCRCERARPTPSADAAARAPLSLVARSPSVSPLSLSPFCGRARVACAEHRSSSPATSDHHPPPSLNSLIAPCGSPPLATARRSSGRAPTGAAAGAADGTSGAALRRWTAVVAQSVVAAQLMAQSMAVASVARSTPGACDCAPPLRATPSSRRRPCAVTPPPGPLPPPLGRAPPDLFCLASRSPAAWRGRRRGARAQARTRAPPVV